MARETIQIPKVVGNIELTCIVLHNILRTYQEEGAQLPYPKDDIVLAHLGVQVLTPWRPP